MMNRCSVGGSSRSTRVQFVSCLSPSSLQLSILDVCNLSSNPRWNRASIHLARQDHPGRLNHDGLNSGSNLKFNERMYVWMWIGEHQVCRRSIDLISMRLASSQCVRYPSTMHIYCDVWTNFYTRASIGCGGGVRPGIDLGVQTLD